MFTKLKIVYEDTRNVGSEYEFNEQYEESYETLTMKEALAILCTADMNQTNDHQIVSAFINGKQVI